MTHRIISPNEILPHDKLRLAFLRPVLHHLVNSIIAIALLGSILRHLAALVVANLARKREGGGGEGGREGWEGEEREEGGEGEIHCTR